MADGAGELSVHEDLASWFVAELSARLVSVFAGLGAKPFTADVGVAGPVSAEPKLWWEQPLSYPPGARVVIGAVETVWLALASECLAAAGIDGEDDTSQQTYLKAITQACGAAAQALGTRLNRDSACLRGRTSTEPPSLPIHAVHLERGSDVLELWIGASIPNPGPQSPPAHEKGQLLAPADRGRSRPMDLLLDVELPVSVSFGRAQLPLKDVIKLTSGSIVELNRSIAEPVEVIVNNCVIARGEVVVIEGNYGVRIDQIVSRQERLRSLK